MNSIATPSSSNRDLLVDTSRSSWELMTVDLASYCGDSSVYIYFLFTSDGSVQEEGVFIDELLVRGR